MGNIIMVASIRKQYEKYGVDNYYKNFSNTYYNPHEKIVQKLLDVACKKGFIGNKVLDLCCGGGEITLALKDREVIGVDPYTSKLYYNKTGQVALPLSFKDIANGALNIKNVDTIICSFALHLCDTSLLPLLLWYLKQVSNTLIIITPNKNPKCDGIFGWFLVEEIIIEKIRLRIYYN